MLINGDCLDVLKTYPDNYFTSIITDPPYGLSFMGKKWDYQVPSIEIWQECLRVLKHGGTMLCFAGSRTQHRMAVNIEDAGFIIKDCLMYLYGSGFPKSLNVGKAVDKIQGNEREVIGDKPYTTQDIRGNAFNGDVAKERPRLHEKITKGNSPFEGYGTALKPAYEPIILAMKHNDGTYANNALKHGVAGINIDKSRVGTEKMLSGGSIPDIRSNNYENSTGKQRLQTPTIENHGRFPANIILDEEAGQLLDEQTGVLNSGALKGNSIQGHNNKIYSKYNGFEGKEYKATKGGASRFFYCAKASKSERNGSTHPTMKPLALMKYLINLIMPPKDGLILDPFMGSGTTLLASKQLGYNAVGIELDKEYFEIAKARVGENL